jgi:hypothetical protein
MCEKFSEVLSQAISIESQIVLERSDRKSDHA